MTVTNDIGDRLLRLPLSANMTLEEVDYIISIVLAAFGTESASHLDPDLVSQPAIVG